MFTEKYGAKYAKAVECLVKDRGALLRFFDFPAKHWDHLRTTNPIESVFATVRHRTVRTKGALSHRIARLMVFKLTVVASKTWRRLKGETACPWSSPASNSPTASPTPRPPINAPPDRSGHPHSAIAQHLFEAV